jgi:lupus La protein
MRRDENKLFKVRQLPFSTCCAHASQSSVFAEFADAGSVEAFLKAEPAPAWNGTPLQIMSKAAYCEGKIKEKGLTGVKAQFRRETYANSAPGGGGGRSGFNAFKEAKKGPADKDKPKPEVWLDFMGSRVRVHEDDEGKGHVKDDDVPHVKKATLKFDGLEGDLNFDDIKVEPTSTCATCID